MKACKSLSTYEYFESGFVLHCGTLQINDCTGSVGKVRRVI